MKTFLDTVFAGTRVVDERFLIGRSARRWGGSLAGFGPAVCARQMGAREDAAYAVQCTEAGAYRSDGGFVRFSRRSDIERA